MEEFLKDKVLDDLFLIRSDGFESVFVKTYGKSEEIIELEKANEELTSIIEKLVQDEKIKNQILEKLKELMEAIQEDGWFWKKQFYKLGFIDGKSFKNEEEKESSIIEKNEKRDCNKGKGMV